MSGVTVLQGVMGGEETWGEDADPGEQWGQLLTSGATDGSELRVAWRRLQQEASEAAIYLGEEVEGVLSDRV